MKSGSIRALMLGAALFMLAVPLVEGVGTGGTGLRVAYVRGALARSGDRVAVNGIGFTPATARITINGVRGRTAADLRDGMVGGIDGLVDAGGTSGVATTIEVNRLVKGATYRVGTGGTGLMVAGIGVTAAPGVVLEGVASVADIAPGDWIDVYGYSDGMSGDVKATRIERIAAGGATELHGIVTALGPTTLVVNGVDVDTTHAVLAGFDLAPMIGDRVAVIGTNVAGGLVAGYVIGESESVRDDAPEAEVEDAVEAVIAANRFEVAGLEVDATAADYSNGAAADIAAGRVVHVTGSIVAGVLVAREVEFDDGGAEAEVEGTISAMPSSSTFVVHGVTVDAAGARIQGGSLSDLRIGRRVEVAGSRDKGGIVRARRVEIDDAGSAPPQGGSAASQVEGRVGAVLGAGLFRVGTTTVDARTAHVTGGTLASVQPGVRVQATGQVSAGVLVARRLSIGG